MLNMESHLSSGVFSLTSVSKLPLPFTSDAVHAGLGAGMAVCVCVCVGIGRRGVKVMGMINYKSFHMPVRLFKC